jgi:hypothetical protein
MFMSFPTVIAIALALAVAVALALRVGNDWRVITLAAGDAPDLAVAEAVQQLHRGHRRL